MHYYLKCSDTSATGRVTSTTTVVREWIEPLTGFLRDPLTKICKQFGKAGVPLQSKDFLLVRSAGVVKPVLPPRGRTILVDAGCGMFSGPKVRPAATLCLRVALTTTRVCLPPHASPCRVPCAVRVVVGL